MIHDQEHGIKNQYRSRGESTIARMLEEYRIPFQYEPDIYLKSGKKNYIWHPDFYLPQYNTVIEYLGLSGNKDYDQITLRKKRVYHQNHYHFIPVYQKTLRLDYQSYIFKSIRDHLADKLNNFYRKTR